MLQGMNGGLSSRSTTSLPCCRLLPAHQVSRNRRHHPAHLTPAAAVYPDVVPHISTRAPKLRGRSIFGNPLHWGWSAAAVAATRLELLSAVWVDRFSNIGPPAVAVLAGALAGLGTTPWALLKYGMPAALQDQLLRTFGIWDTSLLNLALAHVGDAAEVHVALKLQGSTAVFDSTQHEQPLQLLLQPVSPELRQTVAVYNPLNVGYWNPRFTWWQPTADVMEKFKGETPKVGEVFWYPVADGAHVPTRIQNIGEHYVELDANYGVAGTMLHLDVQLVRLYKPADAAPVDAADSQMKTEATGAIAE
eukprot:gene2817-3110_t